MTEQPLTYERARRLGLCGVETESGRPCTRDFGHDRRIPHGHYPLPELATTWRGDRA